ncbi:MAG: sulfatase-like hydrolase/transferase [Silvibacterium sp.]
MKVRSFVEGAGIAILLLADHLWPILSPHHTIVYHDPLSLSMIAGGIAIDVALATLLFTIVLALQDRYRPQQTGLVWAAVLAVVVAKAVDFTLFLLKVYHASFRWTVTMRVCLLFVALGAGLFLSRFFPPALRGSVKAARVGLAMFGCCIFWVLPQLAITALRTHAPAVDAFNRSVQRPSPSSDRIVWILLDELSYDQVFDHPQSDVKLPHFDRLKNESVVFADVQPEGYYTERILPALFLGRKIDNIRSSWQRDLYIHDGATSRWMPFNQQASIFGAAQQSGWTTGVAGWYNPYCHILQNVLDSCYWQYIFTPFPPELPGRKPTLVDALVFPFGSVLSHFKVAPSPAELEVQAHTQEYKDLVVAADALIRNESIRFVFLHLPVPHPPGIYDRKTNTLGVRGTYLDNLVLADKTLGSLLDAIQRTAAASRTTVIISSDHSWRVNMWRSDPSWTKEEERASGGRFDTRPVLLIHFPGSDAGELRTEKFPELGTNGIIRAMLQGELHSQADLDAWLSKHEGFPSQNLALKHR